MSKQFIIAQAGSSGSTAAPVQIIKVIKPPAGHTEVFHASFTGAVKVDFTAIANEKITLYHDNTDQTLHIIFTDGSQAIIEPFFDSMGVSSNITIEVAPNQDLNGAQFAAQFPITEDQTVLPAAGPGAPGTPASGADFQSVSVDPLAVPPPLPLLPPEELPPITFTNIQSAVLPTALATTITVSPGLPLVVDESFIPVIGSQQSPSGSNSATVDESGAFNVSGGGTTTYSLTLNNAATGLIDSKTGTAVTLVQVDATHINAVDGSSDVVFTLALNSSTGVVTMTELRGVHEGTPDAGHDSNESITLASGLVSLTATNGAVSADLDLGSLITVHDDGPTMVSSGTGPSLSVDESFLTAATNGINGSTPNLSNTHTSGSFAGAFISTPGADGAASTSYALSINGGNGTATNFVDAQTGSTVVLVNNGGVIEGHVGTTGGALAFTLSVDSSGNVTFTEDRSVKEATASNPDTSEGITLSSGLVSLTATITDNDGDTASSSIDIGHQLTMLDDGPTMVSSGTGPSLSVDESFLTAATNGINGSTPNLSNTHTSGSFAGAFISTPGADGAASTSYALSINGGNGTATNFVDAQTGSTVVLVNNGGVIEGHVGTTGGALAFTLSVDSSGNVTFTEDRSVKEATASNPDTSEGITLSSGLVSLTATITDNDGDTASSSIDIGHQLTMLDDGPTMVSSGTGPSLSVDESFLTAATNGINGSTPNLSNTHTSGSFAGAFISTPGADGAASTSYALSINGGNGTATNFVDAQTGSTVVLVNNGGVIEGHVGTTGGALAFTLSVDSSGNVTFTEDRSVKEATASNPDTSEGITLSSGLVSLTATITDNDGDTASSSIDIGHQLTMLDDGPTMVSSGTGPSLSVDESFLTAATNGINGSTPNLSNTHTSGSFAGAFISTPGADGAASTSYALSINGGNGTATNFVDAQTGSTVVLVNNGGVIEGHVGTTGGALAFTLSVDSSGNVTFTEDRSVKEATASNPDTSEGITLSSGLVSLTATITDNDGDTASSSIDIGHQLTMLDDGPTMVSSGTGPSLSVDESFLTAATNGINGSTPNLSNTHTSGSFAGAFISTPGADGAASTSYALSINGGNGTATNFVDAQTGSTVVLVNNGGVIEGHVGTTGGALAFTLSVDSSGNVTFTEDRSVKEATASNPDTSEGITLSSGLVSLTATITDNDGDTASSSIDIGHQLTMLDDGPTMVSSGTGPSLSVDESFLTAATNGINGSTPNLSNTHTSGSFAGAFISTPGADGAASTSYALSINGGNGTATNFVDAQTGSTVVLVNNGGVIEGHVGTTGGALAFTLSVDSSGNVTFTEDRSVKEATASNPDTSEGITLSSGLVSLTATITDNDGDTASSSIDIGHQLTMLDDGPTMVSSGTGPSLSVDESFLTAATNGINGSTPNLSNTHTSGSFAGAFISTPGADGAASTSYALSINGGNGTATNFVDAQTGSTVVLVNNGGVIEGHVGTTGGALAFTLSVDSSGNVTFTEDRSVKEATASNPDTSEGITLSSGLVSLTATITDNDGDTASSSIDIGHQLTMLDDGPTMVSSGTGPSLSVDESFLTAATNGINGSTPNLSNTHTSGSFAGAFISTPGADGAASTSYALSINGGNGTATNFVDAQTGSTVVLVNNGGVIEGHVGTTGGALAFTLSVDSSGNVTFTEDRSVKEATASNPDTSEGITLSSGLVSLTATITDNDGDTASSSIDIGHQLTMLDDGPTMVSSGTGPSLSVDESFLTAATNGINGSTPNLSNTHTSGSFAGAFISTPGADGAASTSYALSINGGNGTATNFVDAQTGSTVVLVNNGGVIEGHVGTTGGALAFTLSVDSSGNVTFTEDRSVKEATASNPDTSEGITLSSGLVSLTATITDNDGDTASSSIDIGHQLTMLDDGPTISSIDNGIIADQGGLSLIGNILVNSGADGFGSHPLSLVGDVPPAGLTFDGQPVNYFVDASNPTLLIAYTGADHTIVADQIFTLSVDPSTDQYTFDLLQPFTELATLPVGTSSAFGAGPAGEQILLSGTNQLSLISGHNSDGTVGDVNGSTVGWGVKNNNFDVNEKMLFDFTAGAQATPGGDPAFTPVPNEEIANYTFSGYKSGDSITSVVTYWDGTNPASITSLPSVSIDPSTHTTVATEYSTPTLPAGDVLYSVSFTDATGSGKVDLVSVEALTSVNLSQNLSFNVTTTDGDGDTSAGTININIDGNSTLTGTSGNDVLVGGSAAETLNGGAGNDALIGSGGADTLTGGTGNDTFKYTVISDSTFAAHDTITDFTHGSDIIDFSAISSITAVQGQIAGPTVNVNPDSVAWYNDGSGNTIVVANTTGAAEVASTAQMMTLLTGVNAGTVTSGDIHHA